MTLQERAWNSVCPLVIKLKKFYSFSLRLGESAHLSYKFSYCKMDLLLKSYHLCAEEALRSLLTSLTCPPLTPTQHLEREQALAKQFAEILHFTLRFDELKVWRRNASRLSLCALFLKVCVCVSPDEDPRHPERLQLLQTHHQPEPDKQHECTSQVFDMTSKWV